jgi:hypothetical protein
MARSSCVPSPFSGSNDPVLIPYLLLHAKITKYKGKLKKTGYSPATCSETILKKL